MPRVSAEHRDARRRQILDAARRCFTTNGFHATSMQDILREAGVSAGGAYRYFESKEAIIGGLVTETIGGLVAVFDELRLADPPPPLPDIIGGIAAEFQRLDEERGLAALVVQVWGEAIRSPTLRAELQQLIRVVRAKATEVARSAQERGEIGPGDPEEIGKALVSVLPGFILQRTIVGDLDAAGFHRGLVALLGRNEVTIG